MTTSRFGISRGIGAEEGHISSKRQQTMAKMTRERAVRERRERKLEKKYAAAAERKAKAADGFDQRTDGLA